jgi:hypothetical protein
MRTAFPSVDADLLRQLYVGEQLTSTRIAEQLRCSSTTVLRRLRRFGISARARGPVPRQTAFSEGAAGSPELAYAVGLTATDGNLSPDGRHMSFVSKDRDLVDTFTRSLGVNSPVRALRRRTGDTYYRVQWCDRRLYDWFLGISLTPAKSLTIRPL